ncbi:MAG: histidine kinase [Heliobacteriaceae bacterium]|nr:histidine kinase [Heliobacteriaceae bacterium]MDD4588205.1 histidine kinase [Heliobacteriaceae bacterium]
MNRDELFTIFSDLLDKITVVKGYLQLNYERKKVDYSLLALQQINDLEVSIQQILVDLKKQAE